MRPPFFGWWIVGSAISMFALQSATFGFVFGAYLLEVEDEFGWSKFAISTAYSVAQVSAGLAGPLQGWLIDRYGPRAVARWGIVLFGASFMLLSTVNNLWLFYTAVLALSIGSNLSGFLTINTSIANWFREKRALAMGVGSTGLGVGGALAPLITWSLVTQGWRPTAFASGVAILVIGLPLVQLLRKTPEEYGLLPDGASNARAVGAPETPIDQSFTVGEALRDRSFWLLSLGHGMALVSVFAIIVHFVPHLVDGNGWGTTSAQAMFALLTTASVVGQIGGGFLGDRFSKTRIAAYCMIGHFIALMILATATSGLAIAAAAIIHGLSWGIRGPLMMAVRADFFGTRHFGTIMGYSLAVVMVGTLVGPSFAGAMSDTFGDYRAAFLILGTATGISSVFFVFARKPSLPPRVQKALRDQNTESE